MDEYELVGAQDGHEPAPKRPDNFMRSPVPRSFLGLVDSQPIALPQIQSGNGLPDNVKLDLPPNNLLVRSLTPQNGPNTVNNAPRPVPASRTRPVWVNRLNKSGQSRGSDYKDSPAKAAWRAGHPFTGRIRLPAPYGQIKQKIIDESGLKSSREAEHGLLERITAETGAFIPPPHNNEQFFRVWGTSEQVRKARLIVSQALAIFTSSQPQNKKKSDHFVKISSYCEQKEERINQIEKHDSMLQLLRQRPDPSSRFPETLIFLWPSDELPMESALGPQLEALDPLRIEFGCPIYVDEELPSYIRVDAYDHDTVLKVVSRLRAEWAELLATMHVKVKLYLIQPPEKLMNCEVQIRMPRLANGVILCTPVLYGMLVGPNHPRSQKDKRELVCMKNEKRLRDAVEQSLQGLRFLKGHVRMRLNFGVFVLDEYRTPQGKPRHSYEEFRTMLFNSKTKGRLIPGLDFRHGNQDLLSRIAAATDLLSPYEATAFTLEQATPLYAVNFEFIGEDSSVLRLEAEFAKSPASGLLEVFQRRWIRPHEGKSFGDQRPPLQIGVIDFERYEFDMFGIR
ncbi:predicted protein [Uncinocarpus reesii 1704]|uniref:DUF7905 domain-containing protein n=1 Tax=Uncinocarpus reesii (strain UAMH 1704) TaxID=336963 RepID=C4JU00_UNCRE|nr:uncharacterized protein UREG_05939 [Uncinocarpus reesii 1704]EEP81097.1 predicted protein [Uncinocarpus reesii 1704]